MAYNLDFSGWQDMRRSVANSIIKQGEIKAALIASRAEDVSKTLSGLMKNALWMYGAGKEKADEDAVVNALDVMQRQNSKLAQEGYTGLTVDPMQALSASSGLTDDNTRDYKRAKNINGLLRYQ